MAVDIGIQKNRKDQLIYEDFKLKRTLWSPWFTKTNSALKELMAMDL